MDWNMCPQKTAHLAEGTNVLPGTAILAWKDISTCVDIFIYRTVTVINPVSRVHGNDDKCVWSTK